MWFKFSRIILKNRIPFLIAIGLITIFMGYRTRFVEMSYELAQLLPESDSTYIDYQNFKNTFGKDGNLIVVGVDDDDLFKLDNFNAWYDLTKDIKSLEVHLQDSLVNGVSEALSIANVYTLKRNKAEKRFDFEQIIKQKPSSQSELDSIKKHIYNQPFYNGYLFKDSIPATIMLVSIDTNVLNSKYRDELFKKIDEEVASFEEKTKIKVHKSGLPYIRVNSTTKVKKEIQIFLLLSILITSLILYLFFRSFKATMYSMLVVCVGVVWSVGIQSLFGYKVTMLTGLIPPLIVVIGIPNCIFLLNKYHSEYKKHGNQIKALSVVIQKIGNAIFLTNTTTALGFATFIFTKSAILVEFGVLAAISIFMVFVLSILIIPIVFSFLKKPKNRHTKHLENELMKKAVDVLEFLVKKKRKVVYIITFIVLAVSIYGISLITTTGNIIDDLPSDDPIVEDLKFFERSFNGVMPFEIVIDTKKKNGVFADNGKALYKIQKLQKDLSKYKEFSKPLSVVEAIKFAYQSYKKGRTKFFILPPATELKKLNKYVKDDSRKNKFSHFIDAESQFTRISFQMADVGTKEMDVLLKEIQPKIDSIFPPQEYNVTLTGTSVTFLKGTNYLVENLLTSLILAIILIASLMSVLFSSVRMVLVSLFPNLLPLITTAGLMGFFGIPIKPSTILIFSIAFGISVDDTIHFLAKYRQELKHRKWNIKESVYLALRETGVSMIYTSVILFFGFGVFTVSSFGGTVALGILVSVTLLFAMLADLVLLPSLLLSLDNALTTKAFKKEALIQIIDEEEDIDLNELEVKAIEKEET